MAKFLLSSAQKRAFAACKVLFGFSLILAQSHLAISQISIPNATPVTENFNGTGTALPSNWKFTNCVTLTTNNTTAIGNAVLNFAGTTTSPALVNGMTIGGPAASNIPAGATISSFNATTVTMSTNATALVPNGGSVAFTNGVAPTWAHTGNRTSALSATAVGSATGQSYSYTSDVANDRAFGFQSSTSFLTPNSVMAHYRNTSGATLTDLSISYTAERYRINSSAASVTFFYSTDGSTWTSVSSGDIAAGTFATGGAAFTFLDATQTKVSRTATITGLSVPSGVSGNIYIRWAINLANANSQGISIDDVSATATFLPCSTPGSQPTGLTFPSVGTAQISGSFTPAGGPPNGYLVVRYPAGSAVTAPSNGTVYTSGNALGLGTVVSAAAGTTFTATGLSTGTNYDFYVYSYNSTSCVGPAYRTPSPLTGTQATGSCAGLSATILIDPIGANIFGSNYTTITGALNDLSGCPITQPTVIELQSNYVSSGETFPITLGAITGSSFINTLTLRPASGATNLSIAGNSSGLPILDINAGTWWRVDGRPGGIGSAQELTVENTNNATTASTAIRLIGGAQNNIVRYCKARSANIGVASGTIFISDGTVSNGNSNNTISDNDVFASGSGVPNVGIGCVGLNTANNANTISNNNIYDFFNLTGNTYGVYVSDLNTNLTISGNSFYQTASRTLTGGAADRIYAPIGVSPTIASTVTGLSISGNFIGGTAPSCGGTPMNVGDNGTATLVLRAIFVQAGTAPGTSIQGNTIGNIAFTSASTSANQSLISAVTGAFNIGDVTPNTFGSATGTGSVTFTQTTSSTTSRLSGIIAGTGTPGAMVISSNIIGALTVSNSSTGRVEMAGIYAQGAASGYTLASNQIGGSTTGSLTNNTSSDSWGIYLSAGTVSNIVSGNTIQNISSGIGRMLGIRTDGGLNTISANTIRNCTSASTGLTGCIGIWAASTTAGQALTGNIIHSLSNTDASAAATAQGIYYGGPTAGTNVIDRNFIHSLSLSTSNTSGGIYGIRVLVGVYPVSIQNNMVRLGIDASGADITTGYSIFGIANASTGTINHYFNTSYIGGTGVSGTTSNTYAFLSSGTGNTRTVQNNIIANTRDGGATGSHYGFQVAGSGANPAGLTMNNNLYQTTGSNGFLGSYGSSLVDLTAIQTIVGQNSNSYVCDPKLIAPDANAASVNLHIQAMPVTTLIESNGLVIGGVTQDFDGQTRSTLTPTDIGADAGNFGVQVGGCNTVLTWNGSLSALWGTPGNWTPAQAPTATTPVIIPGVAVQPAISGTVNALSLTLNAAAAPTIGVGGILHIKGDASGATGTSIGGAGKVVFSGTGLQTVTGGLAVSNVDFNNTSAQGVVIGPGAELKVNPSTGNGIVSFVNNARLTINGKFILGSNSAATAKIGPMPATTFITGNTTVERYLPYSAGTGGWYLLGSPITGQNFADYSDDFSVTGLNPGFGSQGGDILPTTNPERNTIFKYVEEQHNTYTDTVQKIGWTIPGNENVIPGNGYRIWVNANGNASHKLDNTGTFVKGDFSFPALTRNEYGACVPASYPCDEISGRGWNLVANPYPCDLDWDAPSSATPGLLAWTKPTQMSNAWYRWHSAVGGYGVYTTGIYAGTTPAPTNPNLISGSQAFFVRLTAPGSYNATLMVKESAKFTTTSGQFLRLNTSQEKIRIHLSQSTDPSAYGYDAVVRFMPEASDELDQELDVLNLSGSKFNLSVPVSDQDLSIASFAPVSGSKMIPLATRYQNKYGSYILSFSEVDALLESNSVFLRDNLLGTLVPVSAGLVYNYTVSSGDGLLTNRFEVIVNPETVTGIKGSATKGEIMLHPNPSESGAETNLIVSGFAPGKATIFATDALARVVWSKEVFLNEGTNSVAVEASLPVGVYTLKINSNEISSIRKWVVR